MDVGGSWHWLCLGAAVAWLSCGVLGCDAGSIAGDLDGSNVDAQLGVDVGGQGDVAGADAVVGVDLLDMPDEGTTPDGHGGDTTPGICGDGVLDGASEACDDGNMETGDGCDPGCQVEPGWLCDDLGCACDPGFFGPECSPCGDCGAFGVCIDGLEGDGSCACESGYQGDDCRSCADGYAPVDGGPWTEGGTCMPNDVCSEAYCSGHGLCVYPDGGPLECHCDAGWEGDDCATDTDECADETLCGGGICMEEPAMELAPECLGQQSDENGDPAAGCPSAPDCEAAVCANDPGCCEDKWDQACADQAWMDPACNAPGYMCECPLGWIGMHCEENLDECAGDENPCANDGECVDTDGSYECVCGAGWSGPNCAENIDECAAEKNPCAHDGECVDTDGSYECVCVVGWTGATCDENVDECSADENPCQNAGVCTDTDGAFDCTCSEGWEGVACAENTDECASEEPPCQNGGACSDQTPEAIAPECLVAQFGEEGELLGGCASSDSCTEAVCAHDSYCCQVAWDGLCASQAKIDGACNTLGFACQCPAGWTGVDCGSDVDECAAQESPCANGAGCQNTAGGFQCLCKAGWAGEDCSANVNECEFEEDVCENAGLCSDVEPMVDAPECLEPQSDGDGNLVPGCQASDTCTESVCANDPYCCETAWDSLCASDAGSNAACVLPGFSCECAGGWTGLDCSVDVDECSGDVNPCLNGAECVNEDGSYGCTCATGFEGDDCGQDIDECADPGLNDCSDHGSCTNEFGAFSCACSAGYAGDGVDCSDLDECEPQEVSAQSFDEGVMPESWVITDSDESDDVSWHVNAEGVLRFSNSSGDGYPGIVSGSVRTAPTPIPEDGMLHADVALDLGDDGAGFDDLAIHLLTCPEEMGWEACQDSESGEVAELWTKVAYYDALNGAGLAEGDWLTIHVDLSAWSGYLGALVFSFDSVHDLLNDAPGVAIDNLKLGGPTLDSCSDMAECANTDGAYECTCLPGWEGDGLQCGNIDECAPEESPCGANSTCEDLAGSFECGCLDGYAPDPAGDAGCVDIDECALNSDDCGHHSVCTNTAGGFACECVAGYGGQDGKACENVDECAEGLAACDDTAMCHDQSTNPCGTPDGCEDEECRGAVAALDVYCAEQWDGACAACASGGTGIGGLDCAEIAISGACLGAEPYLCSCDDGFSLSADGTSCSDVDECLDAPCVHGSCTNEPGTYVCECEPGWEGVSCELNANECVEAGLCNHGECQDVEPALAYAHCTGNLACDVVECQAAVGAFDDWCLTHWDLSCATCAQGGETEYADCSTMGSACFAEAKPGYDCLCEQGWVGEHCDVDVDECVDAPCKNGGECDNTDGGFECSCASGWTGDLCSEDLDECEAEPCLNGACMNYEGGYLCACDWGWSGSDCTVDINECVEFEEPCIHGTCHNLEGGYECECPEGWTGDLCGSDVNECVELAPCLNGACNNTPGSYTCTCDPGWVGGHCGEDVDECLDAPCANATKCVNQLGSYACECKPGSGWEGQDCDVNTNECEVLQNPCHNGGVCIDSVPEIDFTLCQEANSCGSSACRDAVAEFDDFCAGDWDELCAQCANSQVTVANDCTNLGAACTVYHDDFVCDCAEGWQGEFCGQDVNECANNPCENGGSCNNTEGGFTCSCPDGWDGELCQTPDDQLIGSYHVGSGPSWGTKPATYTCKEGCAQVFGGSANSYRCSTNGNSIDHMGYVSIYGVTGCHLRDEDHKVDSVYNSHGDESAYVKDNCTNGTLNYCWQ